ncbi:DNA mismatch repair endonuclease MutL [Synechococcus elongatus]|uniref:DNA mismatch repair endonuclease MutL n=1 Tax=Synechococcus elongatus TaxID=32046 RepID=UPI000F7EF162|nr:DNA mismatch repair endonuclease MutL [Synechococcus elongatus]
MAIAPTIQPLPAPWVARMAAGEVIDSLAAVVRELCENSLDAGTQRLVIDLWPEQWRVRVADDGMGLSLENLQLAALAHTSSKLSPDRFTAEQLGFRGEALHSLARLGRLTIASRTADAAAGWQISYDIGGQPQVATPIAIAPGCIVEVQQLFQDWLERRQSQPSPAQQLRAVQQQIQNLVLAHPSITVQVTQNDRPWLAFAPVQHPQERLLQLLPNTSPADWRSQQLDLGPEGQLQVVVGLPDRCHRRRPDWVKVAVNGRVVRVSELEQAMIGALHRSLPRDRFPVVFAHLQVPPSQVDWHRHPAKAELFLQDLPVWCERIQEAIAQTLPLDPAEEIELPASTALLRVAETTGSYSESPSHLRAIAQVLNTYVLAEQGDSLWLIEQHIAHERVLFEQLQDDWQLVACQQPILLSKLSLEQRLQLDRLGITAEDFGEDLWAIRHIPAALAQRKDLVEALLELSRGWDLSAAQAAIACRTAIRNGTLLYPEEQQTLIDRWQHCRQPRTCPHGRPIALVLPETSLARYFRRQWMIGRSHGLGDP